jgi:hypothetical protein
VQVQQWSASNPQGVVMATIGEDAEVVEPSSGSVDRTLQTLRRAQQATWQRSEIQLKGLFAERFRGIVNTTGQHIEASKEKALSGGLGQDRGRCTGAAMRHV